MPAAGFTLEFRFQVRHNLQLLQPKRVANKFKSCTTSQKGIVTLTIWSLFWSILTFGGMKLTKQMTVSEEAEFEGLDVILHGETAYHILADDQK